MGAHRAPEFTLRAWSRLRPQAAADTRAKFLLRLDPTHIDSAVEESVDEAANKPGAVNGDFGVRTNVGEQAIELDDLPVEQHDRDLRPCFSVDAGPAPPGGRGAIGARSRHGFQL